MDPIPANPWQLGSVLTFVQAIVSPSPVLLAPPTGDATPQTHAFASLTG